MPEGPRVVFIGGLGRSGSTILDLMLGQLPGFVAVGELAYVWGRSDADLCGCGRAFSRCPFWIEVGEHAFGGWSRVDRPRIAALRAGIERNRQIPALVRDGHGDAERRELDDAIHRLHRAIGSVSGADVVIDSTKHPASAYHLHAMGADLRVIHLLRDPRGVAYSWTKVKERPGIAGGAMMDRYPPWRIAGRWLTFNGAFHGLERLGVPTLRVRYEDLVTEPHHWLTRMQAFSAALRRARARFDDVPVPVGPNGRPGRSAHDRRQPDAVRSRLGRASTGRCVEGGPVATRPASRHGRRRPVAASLRVRALTLSRRERPRQGRSRSMELSLPVSSRPAPAIRER